MKYIKKPIEVEAWQWFQGVAIEGVEEVHFEGKNQLPYTKGRIQTISGLVFVSEGDWVLKGAQDEMWSLTDNDFRKEYDKA